MEGYQRYVLYLVSYVQYLEILHIIDHILPIVCGLHLPCATQLPSEQLSIVYPDRHPSIQSPLAENLSHFLPLQFGEQWSQLYP